ncbi:MAG: signal peptidase II [Longimicrobiales bacterium]
MKHKSILAALLLGGILVLDIATKQWALDSLAHGGTIMVAGVPLTLAFNTGIAFGLDVPSAGRWILIAASVFVVIMLAGMFMQAKAKDWLRVTALALVAAGALGNLRDRIRWDRGVVDFIGPIDLGFMHWPIFNVADMAITTGAIALGLSLWREGAEAKALADAAGPAAGATDA